MASALAETQPYPVKPPPFTRQTLTEDMLTTRTPEAHAAVLDEFRKLIERAMFTPPCPTGTIVFPGVDGGGEWGGAAFDPDTGLLYVNSNEMPWIIRLMPRQRHRRSTRAIARAATATDRTGSPAAPSLVDIGTRTDARADRARVIRAGHRPHAGLSRHGRADINELVEFLVTGQGQGARPGVANDPNWLKYRNDGMTTLARSRRLPADHAAVGHAERDRSERRQIRWQIPFGEYPELVAKGMKDTGSDNYGGPVVTASGLLFIGATSFDKKFHAFDKLTGKLLWETTLPAAGNATPSTYMINGRQYVVIVVRRRQERRAVGEQHRGVRAAATRSGRAGRSGSVW